MKKICGKCGIEKDIKEFNANKAKKDGLQCRCKICDTEYGKKYYKLNKKLCKDRIKANKKNNGAWFRKIKESMSCKRCGDARWYVLDFHHKNKDKEIEVSILVGQGYKKQRILEEIAKCDCLCANCHREVHYLEKIAEKANLAKAQV